MSHTHLSCMKCNTEVQVPSANSHCDRIAFVTLPDGWMVANDYPPEHNDIAPLYLCSRCAHGTFVSTDRFLAGAVLVCCGALLAAGGQVSGSVGAGFVAQRGCELMGIPSPDGTSALAYVSAAARAVMARWPS